MTTIRMLVSLLALLLCPAWAVAAAKFTNEDVLKLLAAKIPVSTVVLTVKASDADFDTSTDAIIALSKKGVPEAVIAAMLEKSSGATAASAAADAFNPEEIVLQSGDKPANLRYVHSTTRSAPRALGLGGYATYAVLPGPKANLRLSDPMPTFIVAVPKNAQPENYITMASFQLRRNNTREVMIGGGYISYSTGIHTDRVIATKAEILEDQSRSPAGFVLYKLSPAASLPPGEYGLVTYNSQVPVVGFFAAGGDSYFDFGVDG